MPLFGTRGAASVTGFGGLAKLGYLLRNSLRFRASNSATLSRTFTTPTDNKKWTMSLWCKRGDLGTWRGLFAAGNTGGVITKAEFYTDDLLYINSWNGSSNFQVLVTSQVFRDPSAWYHLVFVYDFANATADNRAKLYVNGQEVTSFSSRTNPSISDTSYWNNASYLQEIGKSYQTATTTSKYFDGYLAEVNFIDGQALTPSSFGKTDPATGQWIPIKYAGTYGTNGFYLPFTNTTSTSTLGNDFSGNGNTWTVNNISLTAGATYDSMTDVPTLGPLASNYCTLNPIAPNATYGIGTVQAGNLDKVAGGTNNEVQGTFGVTSGKWYFEYSFTTSATRVGIATGGPGKSAIATKGVLYENSTGDKLIDGTSTAYGATFNQTNVIGVALNADTNSVTFYKDNASQGSISFTPTDVISPSIFTPNGVTLTVHFNAGQRPFTYTPPSGFKSLNTFNLP